MDAKITYVPTRQDPDLRPLQLLEDPCFRPAAAGSPPIGDATNGGQLGNAPGLVQSIGLGATHTFTPHSAGRLELRLHPPAAGVNIRSHLRQRAQRSEDSRNQQRGSTGRPRACITGFRASSSPPAAHPPSTTASIAPPAQPWATRNPPTRSSSATSSSLPART